MKLFEHIEKKTQKEDLPVLPLRETAVFPSMVSPFFVGRKASISAVEKAMDKKRRIFLVPQKTEKENPGIEDLYEIGCIAHILQMLKLPDGSLRLLVEGRERANIIKFTTKVAPYNVQLKKITETTEVETETAARMRTVQEAFERYAKLNKKITKEITSSIKNAQYPDKLVNLVCAQVPFKLEKKVELLKIEDPVKRLDIVSEELESEIEVLDVQNQIQGKVKKRLEKTQREYYLNEQLKEINKELGRDSEDSSGAEELKKKIEEKALPDEVREKANREVKRLGKLQPMSPEAGILRTYLEWITELPWSEHKEENTDIDKAEKILEEDHYNMKKPKERVLDFIAVRQLKEKIKGPILCFVGPPGTGKTSLGKSVARALNREFVRISLGGVRDEAEIRGHRKTYVGALPGKIIQSMRKVGSVNPVFLLDEIDKLSSDFRGDPASALLEVLDPEQNSNFLDHYLELPYDLSDVMFITTANSLYNIPHPLRDRMEIIEIPGYTDYEKEKIATQFIIPKQLKENGLDWADIKFQKNSLMEIIRNYTMESGVRNLEREIAAVVRKIARNAVRKGFNRETTVDSGFSTQITPKRVRSYLGKARGRKDVVYKQLRPGLVYGLAWTEQGGTLLPVEVVLLEGNGELILTGNLGEVMKESAKTAFSFLQSHSRRLKLANDFSKYSNVHVHVPEGAIPKDGPSAGITLASAILSAFWGKSIKTGFAMTGEVTLTGRLLEIGGVKEKVLAAHRNNIKNVILPADNKKDLDDLPKEITQEISFHFCETAAEALDILFQSE